MIFDNVFVPNERIFLDGEVQQAAVLAHSLGLWERAAGVTHGGAGLEREVGMAALLAEANGVENEPHIKDALATLVIHSTMCKAAGEAAMANGQQNEDGILTPSPLYISALKYYKNEFHAKLLDILHDIAGTLTVNAPTFADFEHPDLHDGLEAMLATSTLSAEQRLRLFHYLRDTTADAYGGWAFATGQLSGGGQHAQRLVTMRHFDMQHAKSLARRILEPAGNEAHEQGAGSRPDLGARRRAARRRRSAATDQVGGALGDGEHGEVGVRRGHAREHGGVDDAQPVDAVDAAVGSTTLSSPTPIRAVPQMCWASVAVRSIHVVELVVGGVGAGIDAAAGWNGGPVVIAAIGSEPASSSSRRMPSRIRTRSRSSSSIRSSITGSTDGSAEASVSVPSDQHSLTHTPSSPNGPSGDDVHPDHHHVVAPGAGEPRRVADADVGVPLRRIGAGRASSRSGSASAHSGWSCRCSADGQVGHRPARADPRAQQDRRRVHRAGAQDDLAAVDVGPLAVEPDAHADGRAALDEHPVDEGCHRGSSGWAGRAPARGRRRSS